MKGKIGNILGGPIGEYHLQLTQPLNKCEVIANSHTDA